LKHKAYIERLKQRREEYLEKALVSAPSDEDLRDCNLAFTHFPLGYMSDVKCEREALLSGEHFSLRESFVFGYRLSELFQFCYGVNDDEVLFELLMEIVFLVKADRRVVIDLDYKDDFVDLVQLVMTCRKSEISYLLESSALGEYDFESCCEVFLRGVELFAPLKPRDDNFLGQSSIEEVLEKILSMLGQLVTVQAVSEKPVIDKSEVAEMLEVSKKTLENKVSEAKKAGNPYPWMKLVGSEGSKWVVARELFLEWLNEKEKNRVGRPLKAKKIPK
jgi:hypothetical protein